MLHSTRIHTVRYAAMAQVDMSSIESDCAMSGMSNTWSRSYHIRLVPAYFDTPRQRTGGGARQAARLHPAASSAFDMRARRERAPSGPLYIDMDL